MNRYRAYEPQQLMMIAFDAEVMFPFGSFERFLVETIGQLDITVFEQDKDDLGGETPYDPRSLLGIVFYGFSKGIFSSRRLSEACRNDLGFMYVAGYAAPEHSTICRFISRHRDAFTALCSQLLYIADTAGFLDYRTIAMDGTKVQANASLRFTGTLADFEKRKAHIEQSIDMAVTKQQTADEIEEREYWQRKQDRYRSEQQRIARFLEHAQVKRRESGAEHQQNITDGDARTLKSKGKYLCGYNAQVATDVDTGMILAADVIDETNDWHAFPFVIERIREWTPEHAQGYLQQSTYLADNGYYSGYSLAYAQQHDLDVYIADRTTEDLYKESEEHIKSRTRVGTHDCTVSIAADGAPQLVCPGGLRMTAQKQHQRNKRRSYRFQPRLNDRETTCTSCQFCDICVGKTRTGRKCFEVDAELITHHEFVARHREKLHSEAGKRVYSRRMAAIEYVFGDIKHNRGLRTFLRRGLEQVRTEWRLLAISFNLARMWRLSAP